MPIFFPLHQCEDDYFSQLHHPRLADELLTPFIEPCRCRDNPHILPHLHPSYAQLILRLPDELLSEIFVWCCPSKFSPNTSLALSALLLAQVCSRWRRIVHSTPSLWTYTQLIVYERQIEPAISLLRLWMDHAGALGVAIDIEFLERWEYPNSVPLLELFGRFVRIVEESRPKHSLSGSPTKEHNPDEVCANNIVSHIASGETDDFPWLETRNLWNSEGAFSPLLFSQQSQKQLSSGIELRSSYRTTEFFTLDRYLIYAKTLTHLSLDDSNAGQHFGLNTAVQILFAFPNLLNLRIHISTQDALETELPDTATVLEGRLSVNLASFSLSFSDGLDIGPLLDVLAMPTLKELQLNGTLMGSGDHWPHLQNFLRVSVLSSREPASGLSHLRLVGFDCFYIDFLGCLRHLHKTLEELEFDDCLLSDDMISLALAPSLHTPSLRSLSLLSCYQVSLSCLTKALKRLGNDLPELQVYVNDCKAFSREERDIAEDVHNLFIGPQYYSVVEM